MCLILIKFTINYWVSLPNNSYRDVTRAIIGGGGVYSYNRVMPDGYLLKSTQMNDVSALRRAHTRKALCINCQNLKAKYSLFIWFSLKVDS